MIHSTTILKCLVFNQINYHGLPIALKNYWLNIRFNVKCSIIYRMEWTA